MGNGASGLDIIANKVYRHNDLVAIGNLAYRELRKYDCEARGNCACCKTARQCRDGYVKGVQKDICPPDGKLVVAYEGDRVVGYSIHIPIPHDEVPLYQEIVEPWSIAFNPKSRLVSSITVDPNMQGRGIGPQLLERTIEEAKRLGTRQLYAKCVGTERDPSCKAFEKKGFDALEVKPKWWPDGSPCTFVYREL